MNQLTETNNATRSATSAALEVTRLAPSPTGALHLGNARTFLINWALARQRGWRVVMRIEDLNTARNQPDAANQSLDILSWLGLDWDSPVYEQAANLEPYHEALTKLNSQGLTYPCTCTRREIAQAQSAPHESDGEMRYPGTCRPKSQHGLDGSLAVPTPQDKPAAVRLRVPDSPVTFDDAFAGRQTVNVQRQVGDFVIATKSQLPAYQLAVVVDDARQGVTQVVRADDLISSAARQTWLYQMLNLWPRPTYTHIPLVLGPDGGRLAKRHGESRLATYRTFGVSPRRVVGLLAYWSGVVEQPGEMTANVFAERFSLKHLPHRPVKFMEADDHWLRAG